MGGTPTINNVTPAVGAIKVQQSTLGLTIPIVWGRARISGNLIWYGDFKAIPHTETTQTGGKGGGGKVRTSTTTYTYTASVAMALCEGLALGVRTCWRGKEVFTGSSYSGTAVQATEPFTYGSYGWYTVAHPNGAQDIALELQVASDFQDDFRFQRSGTWITLSRGVDYTFDTSNGNYAPLNGAFTAGDKLRATYSYISTASGKSCLSQIGLDHFRGEPDQVAWPYLVSRHPDQAVNYSGISYVCGANYSMPDAQVENHSFEVESAFMFSATIPDANPAVVAVDALTNPQYGARFGLEKIAATTDYQNACTAQGIFLSPALTEQTSAATFLDSLAALTNVGIVWSGNVLKFVPYADMPMTGNGVTFTPNTTPIYDLTDDDFQEGDEEGPVKVSRSAVSDSFNLVRLEICDRNNAYNLAIVSAEDQADIQENGARAMSTVTAHWITEPSIAKIVAQLLLQRSLGMRNTYEFRLGWTKIALEPMDLVTLTDAALGLIKQPVRITRIEEDEDGYLMCTAEDFPKGSASATLYPSTSSDGFEHDYNESPGVVSAPVIFEGPAALAQSSAGLELWLAAGGASATYGGCEVWVSLTGSNYQRMATINGSSRYGTTTSALGASSSGAVTTETFGVSLLAGGQMLSASFAEMQAFNSLCYVGGEFLGYEVAALSGANAYTLGNHTARGAYLSAAGAHAAGVPFVRCDEALARVPLTADYIGKTVHVKLLPFNRYGGALGDLGSAVDYTYTVSGAQANLPPIAPLNLGTEGAFTINTAKFKWDRIGNAASYNVQVWAGSPAAKVREVNAGDSLRFDYSASDAKTDGGPWRSVTLKVQGVNANGAAGAFSSFTATNAQVGAITGARAASAAGNIQFACDRPADPDLSGFLVWLSATSGFTPDASTLVYDGASNNVTINRLTAGGQLALGTTYYLRAAAYDNFDKLGLTLSAELPVSISNVTGNQTAILQLYRWSTATPGAPTGTSSFAWATGANTGYSTAPDDGWRVSPPSNPGTPGAQLYVATLQIAVPIGTTTSTVSYSGASVAAWSQNGANGANGVQAFDATIYQWALTIPAGPTGSATLTWSTFAFGTAPTGWTLTPGTQTPGYTLWAARVKVTDSATAATTAFNWSSAAIVPIGASGGTGSPGVEGLSSVTAYCASASASTSTAPAATTGKTSVPAANSGGITGTWLATVPTLSSDQRLWTIDGSYNPATNTVTWSIPYISSIKAGSISTITSNTGALTVTGTISSANGKFAVDANGAVTMKAATILTDDGIVVLQSGVPLAQQTRTNINLVPRIRDWPANRKYNGADFAYNSADTRSLNGEFLYLPGNGNGAYVGWESMDLGIGPGETYTVSFHASAAGQTFNVDLYGTNVDSTGVSVSQIGDSDYSFTEVMPANATGDARMRFFAPANGSGIVFSNIKIEYGTRATAWTDDTITTSNVSRRVMPNSITNTQIGGDLLSTNYVAGSAGWRLDRSGTFYGNNVLLRGFVAGGAFSGFTWPANNGTGYYVGPEGAMWGNPSTGKFLQIYSDGNIYAPNFTIINGIPTFSNAVINSSQLDSFTASFGGSAGGSFGNGSAGYGTLTANPSGGRPPYTFRWVLTVNYKSNNAGNMAMDNPNGQSCGFSGSGTNCVLDYYVTCFVTDANNRTVPISGEIYSTHGTPP